VDEVIETILESYRTGATDAYASCLAPDFVFVLHENPRPIFGADPPLLWDRETEIQVHERMFGEGADAPTSLSVDWRIHGDPESATDVNGNDLLVVVLHGRVAAVVRGASFATATSHRLHLRQEIEGSDHWLVTRWEEGNPILPDIYYEPHGDPVSTWQLVANTEATLYWYGKEFTGPVEFEMAGLDLTINGVCVPLHHALPDTFREVEPTLTMLLDRQARLAMSFEEWVQTYSGSELVGELVEGEGWIRVHWVGVDTPYYVTKTYHPPEARTGQALTPEEGFHNWIGTVTRHLEQGNDVWVHGAMLYSHSPGRPLELPQWASEDMQNPLRID